MRITSILSSRNSRGPASKALTRVTQVYLNFSSFLNQYYLGDKEPMLYVDVNLGNSGTQRIVVYEGETAEGLAEKFAKEWELDS